jgi:hypothetical protein
LAKTNDKSSVTSESRRQFVKKAAYVAPAVLTLQAASTFARAGSTRPRNIEDETEPLTRHP